MSFSENPFTHIQFKVVEATEDTWSKIDLNLYKPKPDEYLRVVEKHETGSLTMEGLFVRNQYGCLTIKYGSREWQFNIGVTTDIPLVDAYRRTEGTPAGVHLECSSCGGGWQTIFSANVTAQALINAQHEHVRNSHKRTPEDCRDWS